MCLVMVALVLKKSLRINVMLLIIFITLLSRAIILATYLAQTIAMRK